MDRNTADQKLTVFAFTAATNVARTGDAANLTAYVSIDGGAANAIADTSASEVSSTNAKGFYTFDLAQAETDGARFPVRVRMAARWEVLLREP